MLLVFFIALSVDKVIIFLGGITVYNTDTGSMRLSPFVSFLCDGNLFLKEKCDTLVMKILKPYVGGRLHPSQTGSCYSHNYTLYSPV